MNLLALDTSGPVAGVCVVKDDQIVYEGMAINRFTHSVSMMPMVEEAFAHSGLTIDQMDALAVTVGPGSFTGVRIGVSTVKGMAHGAGKACIPVDALEAMADSVPFYNGIVCPIQDARAGQVYGAAFEGQSMKRLLADEPIRLEDYLEKASAFGKKMLFLGDGMPVHKERIAEILGEKAIFAPAHLAYLRPAAAAQLAWEKQNEAVSYLDLQPLYLRAPQAERQKNLREKGHE